jgi:hypothetical protein
MHANPAELVRDLAAHRGSFETALRAVEPHGKAARIAGFGQECLRALSVVRQPPVELRYVSAIVRRDQHAGRHTEPTQGFVSDRFNVERLVDRLAHPPILERVATLDVGCVQFRAALVEA